MANTLSDSEPLCDTKILKTKRVTLVENIAFENVMPSVSPFLAPNQIDEIDGEKSQFAKMRKVLDYVDRLTHCSRYTAFNTLMKAIGGTQPELFKRLVGRTPTEAETIFCVQDIAENVKDKIIKMGHCIDSELDERISFEYQHVELSIVDRNAGITSAIEVPHDYGEHLTRLQGSGNNISACDILSSKSKANEKVLVFGRPGVGKSTTTQWLARQWALGKWATGVTLLFLLQVRFLANVDVPITALDLLSLYSLFQLEDKAYSLVLSSWLKNPASRILIFIDGLDEIPGFASRLINTCKICDLTHKAHPIDLIVNILRGNLLPHGIVISASRPFLGLGKLSVDSKAEVLGLTSRKVTEYVEQRHPEKANHILSVLSKNHILLSVCGITFYCMLISRLLSEGVVLIDEEVQTYTRLMAFILVQYTCRKIPGSDFSLETSPYLGKLTHLAFSGIFQSPDGTKLAKLVFDNKDLINSKLSIDDLDCVKKTGIIQIREHQIGGHKSIAAEFFHLCGQEILAVLHFLSDSQHSDDVLHQLFAGGHFDMALMYTFGINFDRTSKWVDELWTAVGSSNLDDLTSIESKQSSSKITTWIKKLMTCVCFCCDADNSIMSQLSRFIDRLWKESESKMKVCQLVYEGQWVEKAKEVFSHIAPKGDLCIESISMTAIDVLAVDFVCRCAGSLSSITLKGVNADATFVKVMMSSLVEHSLSTLQVLDLSRNTIGAEGAKALAEGLRAMVRVHTESWTEAGAKAPLAHTNTSLCTLDILMNSIGDARAEAKTAMAQTATSLHTLNLASNSIGDAGAEALANALPTNTTLHTLDVSYNRIGDVGTRAMTTMLTSLQTLNISHNNVCNAGLVAMAKALQANTSLKTLDISYNRISDTGAEALADTLTHNTSLHILNISHNGICDAGVVAMAAMLETNASLRTLHVSYNRVGDVGAEAMVAALYRNTTLTELDIGYNNIGHTGDKALTDVSQHRPTLTVVLY